VSIEKHLDNIEKYLKYEQYDRIKKELKIIRKKMKKTE